MTPETDGIVVSHKRKDYHSDGFAWTRKTFRQLEVAQWCDRVKSYGWVYHYEWQHLIHYWYQNIYYSSSKGFICTRQTNSPNCARQANEQKVKEYRIQLSTAARVCISRRLHPQGWKNSLQRRDGRALVLDRREKQRQTHTHTHNSSAAQWNVQQNHRLSSSVYCVLSTWRTIVLGPPCLTSSLLLKYNSPLFFPSDTRRLELVLTGG